MISHLNVSEVLFNQICTFTEPNNSFRKLMGLDAYLGLLDYEGLQLARQDSAEARGEAKKAVAMTEKALIYTKWSLWIAGGVGLIQIILTLIRY